MLKNSVLIALLAALACNSPAVAAPENRAFDLGGANVTPSSEVVRLTCLARDNNGATYVANIAVDKLHQTVVAYVPVLDLGFKFVDGQSGDPQYGKTRVPIGNLTQHVSIAGNTVTIVNETPAGSSVTIYDLATNSAIATNTMQKTASTSAYQCERVK